jgi:acyl-ACP thioesterase
MKLTKAQWFVIDRLQRGGLIIHDDQYFQISLGFEVHRIQWRVWQSLNIELELIRQQTSHPFDFILTKKGENYKHISKTNKKQLK